MNDKDELKYIKEIPDINNPSKMSKWVKEKDDYVYIEGFCDKCLAGTGFPKMKNGGTQQKLNYIEDLMSEILLKKANEKGFKLINSKFIELEVAENLYAIIIGKFIPVEL